MEAYDCASVSLYSTTSDDYELSVSPLFAQTWLCYLLPNWLWVRLVMRINSVVRKRSLYRTMEQGTMPLFARKRHSSAGAPALLGFRPGRRSSGLPTHRPLTPDPLRRVSMEENTVFSPLRASSGASHKSITPIPESLPSPHSPLTPSTPRSSSPLSGAFMNGRPVRGSTGSAGDQSPLAVPPRRTSSASAAESGLLHRRHTLPKKLSRVLVVPSVAIVSQSPDKEQDTHGRMYAKETPSSEHWSRVLNCKIGFNIAGISKCLVSSGAGW